MSPTRFVELSYANAEQAQEALAGREGSGIESIGLWPGPAPKYAVGAETVAQWGAASGYDAVIWTALRPKFRGVFGLVPENADDVVRYLRELDEEASCRARDYVCNAPPEVRTPYRAVIEAEFGWLPQGHR